jgi:hypothetical protein
MLTPPVCLTRDWCQNVCSSTKFCGHRGVSPAKTN